MRYGTANWQWLVSHRSTVACTVACAESVESLHKSVVFRNTQGLDIRCTAASGGAACFKRTQRLPNCDTGTYR